MAEIFPIVATCVGLASEIGRAINTIDTLILQAALDTPGKVDDAVKQHFECSLKNCMKTVTRLHHSLESFAKHVSKTDGNAGIEPITVDVWSRMKFLWDESNISQDKTELHEHMQAVDVLLHVVQFHQRGQQREAIDREENAAEHQTATTQGEHARSTSSTGQPTHPHAPPAIGPSRHRFPLSFFGERKALHKQLCKAAAEGDVDTIKALIQKGAKVGPSEHKKYPLLTPVGRALLQRKLSSILVLVEYGAPVNFGICDDTQSSTPLGLAAEMGSSDDIEILIQRGADPDLVTKTDRHTPLHIAAMLGRLEAVKALVRGGASLGARGPQGQTPLHMASTEIIAQALIDNGAPTRVLDDDDELPIHAAARRGFREAIATMLSQSIPLNCPNKLGLTPLNIACENGHLELVRYLSKRGGRLGRDDKGIARACVFGATLDTIEAYIAAGADLNLTYNYWSYLDPPRPGPPIHYASAAGGQEILGFLLQHKASINEQNPQGLTALHWVVSGQGDRQNIIRLLIQMGADLNSRDKQFDTPLHIAARFASDAASNKPDPNIEELLQARPDVNSRNSKGETCLHVLCECTEAVASLKALLDAGADYRLANDELCTPRETLVKRAKSGHNMARALTRAGAKGFDRRKERVDALIQMIKACDLPAINSLLDTSVYVSNTAFCAACAYSTPGIVKRLIEAGANVNGPSYLDHDQLKKQYPLHLACQVWLEPVALELCNILLDAGAWPAVEIDDGCERTPLYFAQLRGHKKVMELLENWEGKDED